MVEWKWKQKILQEKIKPTNQTAWLIKKRRMSQDEELGSWPAWNSEIDFGTETRHYQQNVYIERNGIP